MSMQPEYGQAISDYERWLANNYEWETSTSEGEASHYVPIDKHAARGGFSSAGVVSYAAGGGIIDEPMIAYGRSGKRIVMGEAGPEYIVPAGAGGQMVHISLSMDSRVIGEAIYDMSKRGQKVIHQRGITAN
jgi:hypothetical protein